MRSRSVWKKSVGSSFQVNGAFFYYTFANDQQPFTVATPGGNIAEIFNVPAVREYGLEIEGVWKPIDPMTLSLQYSYMNTRVTDAGACVLDTADPFAVQPGANTSGCGIVTAAVFGDPAHPTVQTGLNETGRLQNLNGEQLPEAPPNKVSFNGQYVFNFEPGKLTFSGSYIWKDKTYDLIFNRPGNLAQSYSTVNLRATFDDAKDRFPIILFADNIFNTLGFDNVTQTRLGGALPPACGGLTPATCTQSFTAAQQPYDVIAEGITAPFTFGAEFQLRFR